MFIPHSSHNYREVVDQMLWRRQKSQQNDNRWDHLPKARCALAASITGFNIGMTEILMWRKFVRYFWSLAIYLDIISCL